MAAGDLLDGLRIGVLCGGPSNEREVSLASGEAVASALAGAGREVVRGVLDEGSASELDALLSRADVFFVALHGKFGEDGTLQALLEERGAVYTGSGPESSRVCFDKITARRVFAENGIPHPRGRVLRRGEEIAEEVARMLPCVVKPAASGSSIGVSIIREASELPRALERAFAEDDRVLAEEYVAGRELTVGFLGERVLPIIELRPAREFYDYDAKYADEATGYICPAALPERTAGEVASLAERAFRALDCRDLGRIDLILGKDERPSFLEMNTIPGFTSHSLVPKAAAAAGIGFGELCAEVLRSALVRAGRK